MNLQPQAFLKISSSLLPPNVDKQDVFALRNIDNKKEYILCIKKDIPCTCTDKVVLEVGEEIYVGEPVEHEDYIVLLGKTYRPIVFSKTDYEKHCIGKVYRVIKWSKED